MKATIDFDDQLYRRLKIEAARRGRTVRDLVADGVRHILDAEQGAATDTPAESWRPEWLGVLRPWASSVADHSLAAIRESIVEGRTNDRHP